MKATNNQPGDDWVRDALDRYEGPLLRYAVRLTGDLEAARDVVQDTFVRLCRADPRALEGGLAAWLYTVCRNRALDLHRKDRRMSPLDDARAASLISRAPGPDTLAERGEAHAEVLGALSDLPAKQQEVLLLKFQAGLSYKEISDVTGHSVSNVGYLIHTAIKAVRAQIGGGAARRAGAGRSL